jgi:hypothetical protein
MGKIQNSCLLPFLSDGGGAYILVDGLLRGRTNCRSSIQCSTATRMGVRLEFVSFVRSSGSRPSASALRSMGANRLFFLRRVHRAGVPSGICPFRGRECKKAVLSRLGPAADSEGFVAPTVIRLVSEINSDGHRFEPPCKAAQEPAIRPENVAWRENSPFVRV